ncbi:MAG: RlmI/RlmK family 23S rRNA methyltransferase, partial [Bilophila sp.]
MQSLFMKKNEDRRLRAGHLWIFSNEVDVKRSPLTAFAPGEAVQVCDSGSRPIGAAYVNPASLIAARIVSRNPDEILNGDLIRKRLTRALSLRERLFAVPFYRLCHGEGDWLPGLVLDRYGDVFSAQITTAGMEAHKATLLEVLQELCKPSAVL